MEKVLHKILCIECEMETSEEGRKVNGVLVSDEVFFKDYVLGEAIEEHKRLVDTDRRAKLLKSRMKREAKEQRLKRKLSPKQIIEDRQKARERSQKECCVSYVITGIENSSKYGCYNPQRLRFDIDEIQDDPTSHDVMYRPRDKYKVVESIRDVKK